MTRGGPPIPRNVRVLLPGPGGSWQEVPVELVYEGRRWVWLGWRSGWVHRWVAVTPLAQPASFDGRLPQVLCETLPARTQLALGVAVPARREAPR